MHGLQMKQEEIIQVLSDKRATQQDLQEQVREEGTFLGRSLVTVRIRTARNKDAVMDFITQTTSE